MTAADPDPPGVMARLERLTRWRAPSPRWRRVIQLVAVTIFVGGIIVSVQRLDLRAADVTWWPLVVLAVLGTPATIAVNAAELRAMTRCLDPDGRLPWLRAGSVVVLATAANVLPLPGGAMVRIQALRAGGATTGRATAINLVAALLWVTTAVVIAGFAVVRFAPVPGLLAVGAGIAGGVVAVVGLRAAMPVWSTASAAGLGLVEVVTTLLHAAKLYLALLALGITAGVDQALVLGVAGPISAAAGVFPSGLGLAEVLAALTAALVALAPAAGFGATALVRVIGLLVTAPLALVSDVRTLADAVEDSDPA